MSQLEIGEIFDCRDGQFHDLFDGCLIEWNEQEKGISIEDELLGADSLMEERKHLLEETGDGLPIEESRVTSWVISRSTSESCGISWSYALIY